MAFIETVWYVLGAQDLVCGAVIFAVVAGAVALGRRAIKGRRAA
ncbi:hypothetical protein [Paraburkholderia bannensis]|nr:hypothetical protein [Paraburkholderia bannensis]